MSNKPFISVITVCLNAERYIEKTICSIINQTYKNIEYIIIDGKSTDQTLQIIGKYRDRIAHVISETDSGIADAMNKGIKLAKGDYVIFIHADDYLVSSSCVEEAVNSFSNADDVVTCSILFGEKLRLVKPYKFDFWLNFKVQALNGCRSF
jgi:glycosyltransferase involved in cell wall biosynthesis